MKDFPLYMQELIQSIENLKQSEIKEVIDSRLEEFSEAGKKEIDHIFKELCFCVMTANCGAEKCLEVHEGVDQGFLTFNEEELSQKFKDLGYRFPNVRAQYIVENRAKIEHLQTMLTSEEHEEELRKWIVKNIKGLGYKEASHFLRNIGYKNYAIVDRHILDVLDTHSLIEKPKSMSKGRYLQIEEILKELGSELKLNMAELDLYLWYMETGKVLK